MKQINYIFVFFLCAFLFSCEKEEYVADDSNGNSQDEFYINLEDTAGVVVPEGYSLVIFPGSKEMTRATVEKRIGHLQYIIYQKEDSGDYIQHLENRKVNVDLSSWPLKAIAIALPKGKEYKAVFLGNADISVFGTSQTTQVLTGTGKGTRYTDARILLPRVEFTDQNMYYLAKSDFNTKGATISVPVTLKRIVSRNDITKEGVPAEYATEVKDDATYKSAYWKQTVKEKMKASIFTGINSTFRYQLVQDMKRCLIYPLVYIGLSKPEDANTQASNYPVIAKYNEEWASMKPAQIYMNAYDTQHKYYNGSLISGVTYANNIFIRYAQYLYDLFVVEESKDPDTLNKILNQIYTDNITIREEEGAVSTFKPSVDAAIAKVIAAFNSGYISGVLLPWRNISYSVVETNTEMPAAVDFELNPDGSLYEGAGSKYYRLKRALDNASDKYISIITLGEPGTSVNQLGISKVSTTTSAGLTIDYVPATSSAFISMPFVAGRFHRNVKSVTTLKVKSIQLINPRSLMNGSAYQQKIEVNYNNLYLHMNPTRVGIKVTIGTPVYNFSVDNATLGSGTVSDIQTGLLNIMTGKYISQELQGDHSLLSFPFVTFTSPDVSSANLDIKTEWITEEVQ